jgi:hypothetical protein
MGMIIKHLRSVTNLKDFVATWVWMRGRKVLVLLLLAILAILLAHMTPPVIIHSQHINLAPSGLKISGNDGLGD